MKFREAKTADIPLIIEMLADDKLGRQRENFQDPLPQEYLSAFENISRDDNQELIVVENEGGDIIGTMQLSFLQYLTYRGGVRAQIEAVRIHKEVRGTGLGTKMFKWAIQRARERNAHVIQLTTDKLRPDALNFYIELGFVASHEGMKMHLT